MRSGPVLAVLLVTGCGDTTPPADMPARSWKYYQTHPDAIDPMLAICRQWAASGTAVGTEPAVVSGNCRAAAFARSMLAQGGGRTR